MPKLGEAAPDFELPNQDGKLVRLSDFRGAPVIIFAFPKAHTMGCTRQACAFRDALPQLEAQGTVVLGVSADSMADLARWKREQSLPYDLLADPEHKMLDAWDAWGFKLLILTLPIAATRSYWVIDEDGILVAQQIGVRPRESVEKALAAVERLNTRQLEEAQA